MHSSRMRTICCRYHWGGGVCLGDVCRGVSAWGGCLPRGGVWLEVSGQGVSVPVHAGIHTFCEQITDACENITLPQLHCRW